MSIQFTEIMKEKEIKKVLGLTVRKHRLKMGVSQEKLAELTDLHRTYISDIERGTRNVSAINIVRLARALKIKPARLLEDLG